METININPLGDTQREQWHSVVNLLRVMGGDLTAKGRGDLCDELDRYIDFVENKLDELRKDAFGIVEWNDDDIIAALQDDGIDPTLENIGAIRTALENSHRLCDAQIEAGWSVIHAVISEVLNKEGN